MNRELQPSKHPRPCYDRLSQQSLRCLDYSASKQSERQDRRIYLQGTQGVHRNMHRRPQQFPSSILIGDDLRIAAITEKTPLAQVAGAISRKYREQDNIALADIEARFLITNPRIAVLAPNPSINEEQSCGKEEREIIIPAIDHLADKGIQAFGPHSCRRILRQRLLQRIRWNHGNVLRSSYRAIPCSLQRGWRALHCRLATYPYRSQHNSLLLHGRLQRGRPNIIPPCYLHGTRCFSAIAKQATRWVQTRCQNSITRSETKVKRFASLSLRSTLHLHSLQRTENREHQRVTSRRRRRTMLQETMSRRKHRIMLLETMSRRKRRIMLLETMSRRTIIRKFNSLTSRRLHRLLQHSLLFSAVQSWSETSF